MRNRAKDGGDELIAISIRLCITLKRLHTSLKTNRSLPHRCRQITCVLQHLAETNDVSIRVGDFELGKAVEHSLKPARNDPQLAELCEYLTEGTSLDTQVHVPIIRGGLRPGRR